MLLKKEYVLKCLWMNVFTFSAKNGIVENSLRILYLCRTHETDSMNLLGSIEPRLRTTGLICIGWYAVDFAFVYKLFNY